MFTSETAWRSQNCWILILYTVLPACFEAKAGISFALESTKELVLGPLLLLEVSSRRSTAAIFTCYGSIISSHRVTTSACLGPGSCCYRSIRSSHRVTIYRRTSQVSVSQKTKWHYRWYSATEGSYDDMWTFFLNGGEVVLAEGDRFLPNNSILPLKFHVAWKITPICRYSRYSLILYQGAQKSWQN